MSNRTLKVTWSDQIEYLFNNADSIPTTGGVYEIQGRKKSDGGYTRRYVGASKNLKQTYSKLLSGEESNEKLKSFLKEKRSFFRYVKSDDEQLRKDLEKGLYHKYKHSFIDVEDAPSGSGKFLIISVQEINA